MTLEGSGAFDIAQAAAQRGDALANTPTIDFQLGFTRTAGADATAKAR
jgi:hypothetical protein